MNDNPPISVFSCKTLVHLLKKVRCPDTLCELVHDSQQGLPSVSLVQWWNTVRGWTSDRIRSAARARKSPRRSGLSPSTHSIQYVNAFPGVFRMFPFSEKWFAYRSLSVEVLQVASTVALLYPSVLGLGQSEDEIEHANTQATARHPWRPSTEERQVFRGALTKSRTQNNSSGHYCIYCLKMYY